MQDISEWISSVIINCYWALPPCPPAPSPFFTLIYLVSHYTREAGVRELERVLSAICRAVAVKVCASVCSGTN